MLGQKIIYALLGDPLCILPDDIRKKIPLYGMARSALIKSEVQIIAASKGENRLKKTDGYIYESLDITDKSQIENIFSKHKPDVVINTAAMTNVDACETKRDECTKANVHAVQYMVDTLENLSPPFGGQGGCHFIHISTDFVFDGMKGSPYTEEDKPNPLHFYAQSKLEGEKIVMASKLKWAIIRTIIVFGTVDDRNRSNLVLWVKNNLEQKKKINVITDQYRAPTLSEDLAQGCILCAMKGGEGIFHMSGKETYSILELANRIADFWKLDKSFMNPVTSAELNQPAMRPPRTGFVIDKAKKVLGYNPRSFIAGLKIIDKQLNASPQPSPKGEGAK